VSAMAYVAGQAMTYVLRLSEQVSVALGRFGMRHRRAKRVGRHKRLGRADADDDVAAVRGLAWA
jgi:hypothetical protein